MTSRAITSALASWCGGADPVLALVAEEADVGPLAPAELAREPGAWIGYGEAARTVQDLYLAKRHRDAAAAVPLEFIDRTCLLGPKERIAERMRDYAAAGVTTLSVTPFVRDLDSGIQTLRTVAEALDVAGVGE